MRAIDSALQGLGRAQVSLERTADRIARAPLAWGDGGDSVSLSDQAVALMTARNAFAMNLRTLKVADEMQKKMLDMLA